MHTVRDLDCSSAESMLLPPFRKVEFQEDFPQVLVSTQLRRAWQALPGQATTSGTVGQFIKANHESTEEQKALVPQNPDKKAIHTEWRSEIYTFWNHLFVDVSRFLQDVGMGIGHLHPPSQDVLTLDHLKTPSEDKSIDQVVKKEWDTEVLLIPAYLDPGVEVRMTMVQTGSDEKNGSSIEKTLGMFDSKNTAEIWYLRAGTKVSFYLEGDLGEDKQGTAAVLVYGTLCSEEHWDSSEQTQEA